VTICPLPGVPEELEEGEPNDEDDDDDTKLVFTLLAFVQSDGAAIAGPLVNLTAAHCISGHVRARSRLRMIRHPLNMPGRGHRQALLE
jgi:hypothetical protein